MARLSELAQGQWDLVTAAQARDLAVSRLDLSRLVSDGALMRIAAAYGVYRLIGAPPEPDLDELRAAWLQLLPRKLAYQ
ncbi:MAG: type IV toxin-antitoxin system AbiEi family antitoxin domain-containing protein, partial [Mycobacteriales bacterium]